MSPSPNRGFDDDDHDERLAGKGHDATLIDDPDDPRQQAMRALVAAEKAKRAADGLEASTGQMPERTTGPMVAVGQAGPTDASPGGLGRSGIEGPTGPMDLYDGVTAEQTLDRQFATTRRAAPAAGAAPRARSVQAEWLEVGDVRGGADPVARPAQDLGPEPGRPRAEGPVPSVIRSTEPPPGPERSVVVQQVSPFGSDARVFAKPKPRRALPPPDETLPFAPEDQPTADGARPAPLRELVGARGSMVERGPARRDGSSEGVDKDDIEPQRYIPTRIGPKPSRRSEARQRPARSLVRDYLPLVSAVFAVILALLVLVKALS